MVYLAIAVLAGGIGFVLGWSMQPGREWRSGAWRVKE